MTEMSLPATGLAEGRFRVGAALHKAAVALWHNLHCILAESHVD